MTVTAGVLDVGVYLTALSVGDASGQNDIWAIKAGTATRIASIVGPDFNVAEVDDISADGRTALVKIGVIHGGLPGPMCSDLYAVKTDGSGAIRLTFNGPEGHADDGAFSPHGRYVAFRSSVFTAGSPRSVWLTSRVTPAHRPTSATPRSTISTSRGHRLTIGWPQPAGRRT